MPQRPPGTTRSACRRPDRWHFSPGHGGHAHLLRQPLCESAPVLWAHPGQAHGRKASLRAVLKARKPAPAAAQHRSTACRVKAFGSDKRQHVSSAFGAHRIEPVPGCRTPCAPSGRPTPRAPARLVRQGRRVKGPIRQVDPAAARHRPRSRFRTAPGDECPGSTGFDAQRHDQQPTRHQRRIRAAPGCRRSGHVSPSSRKADWSIPDATEPDRPYNPGAIRCKTSGAAHPDPEAGHRRRSQRAKPGPATGQGRNEPASGPRPARRGHPVRAVPSPRHRPSLAPRKASEATGASARAAANSRSSILSSGVSSSSIPSSACGGASAAINPRFPRATRLSTARRSQPSHRADFGLDNPSRCRSAHRLGLSLGQVGPGPHAAHRRAVRSSSGPQPRALRPPGSATHRAPTRGRRRRTGRCTGLATDPIEPGRDLRPARIQVRGLGARA